MVKENLPLRDIFNGHTVETRPAVQHWCGQGKDWMHSGPGNDLVAESAAEEEVVGAGNKGFVSFRK